MANLRAKRLTIRSSTSIEVLFTDTLDPSVGVGNIAIGGAGVNQASLTVRSVEVSGTTLTILVRPMVAGAQYEMVLSSTQLVPFASIHGDRLLEDGATNHLFFIGEEEANDVRDSMLQSLTPVYDTEQGLLRDCLSPTADAIADAKHAIDEVGASNYVSVEVVDEPLTRREDRKSVV